MIEGPIERFRNYQGITDRSGITHVYDASNNLVDTTTKGLRIWVIENLSYVSITDMEHPGVHVYAYEHNDGCIYLLSLKDEVLAHHNVAKMSYGDIPYTNIPKYIHNEKGYANVCLDNGRGIYVWHGEKLSREGWELKLREKNFNKNFDDWINS